MLIGAGSHVARAAKYCRDVVAGKIPACVYVRQACQRQLDDLERQKSKGWPYRFDKAKAERVCRFIEKLPHIKGPMAAKRQPMLLQPWQSFILTTVYGWVHKEGPKKGRRRFRIAYIEVPKGNGKSALLSGVSLYALTADGEQGAEVYSAAVSRDQAGIVFKTARQMALRRPGMCKQLGIHVGAHALSVEKTASTFLALSADADNIEGKNVHCAVVDELHAHSTRAVFDNLETAMGKRDQPLMFAITTAGDNQHGICYQVRADVLKILSGAVVDETIFGIVYTIDRVEKAKPLDPDDDGPEGTDFEGDDPYSVEAAIKANPNYGVSVDPDHIARMAAKALRSAADRPRYLTKHLDIWINAYSALFDMQAWKTRCVDDTLELRDFDGMDCFSSADLASKTDLASRCRLFIKPGEWLDPIDNQLKVVPFYYVFGDHHVPRKVVEEATQLNYAAWELDGWLEVHEGDVTDFDVIQAAIEADAKRFRIVAHGYDPWQSHQMATSLQGKNLNVVEMPQQVRTFSAPTKEVMALILQGRVRTNGDPVLEWAMSNVVGKYDRKENVFPTKNADDKKIDPAIALIMAFALALTPAADDSVSIPDGYEV